MSTQENKTIYCRFLEEMWNERKYEIAEELFAENYAYHDPAAPGVPPGPACAKLLVSTYVEAFPDVRVTIDEMLAEGDLVATRWRIKGTHRGPLMGIPATGKVAEVSGLVVARIAGGKIAEAWTHWDSQGLMKQLGVG
jgi:steroid delta-isomerase-like uncharacterized protein